MASNPPQPAAAISSAASEAAQSTPSTPSTAAVPKPRRVPLQRSRRRISYERRVRLALLFLALASLVPTAWLIDILSGSSSVALGTTLLLAAIWAIAASYFFDQVTRPLQTLSNVVSALREDDFSFRTRGARRGDSLGDLALEINALADTLQRQRLAARDALTLVERVISSIQAPILAFDPAGALRLLNPAAEAAFHLDRRTALNHPATALHLDPLLTLADQGLYTHAAPGNTRENRWSVRRTTFHLQGIPHTLLLLSDVAAALREEERLAWQRLIRVLSHEINNSLTPIKSLAGSLRSRLPNPRFADPAAPPVPLAPSLIPDFHRGLTVIEDRAASLNRFLQAYQQLSRLPAPRLEPIDLSTLLARVIPLETRLAVELHPGPPTRLFADPDQLQQLLINLLRNAVEAALTPELSTVSSLAIDPTDPTTPFPSRPHIPAVALTWLLTPEPIPDHVLITLRDNGPGLTNPANLFVPFYTTKPGGTGIGLVLAQQIAVAHKGSITLTNNLSAPGCTAEVRLPLP